MTEPREPAPPPDVRCERHRGSWGGGWRRYFFPGFWLVYLGQTVDGVGKHSHGAGAVVGYVIVVAFAACYLAALPMGWDSRLTRSSGRSTASPSG